MNERNIPDNIDTMNKCKNIYHKSSLHRESYKKCL
jgi:hypothetical protein